jgi:hypothetical protein
MIQLHLEVHTQKILILQTFGVIVDILLLKQYVYLPDVGAENVNTPEDSLSTCVMTAPSGPVIVTSMSKKPPSAISNFKPAISHRII